MSQLLKKLRSAKEVFHRSGPSGIFRHSVVVAADHIVNASIWFAAKVRKQSHSVLGYGHRHLLRRNRHFQNIHLGRRAFILGTGPSLAHQDLTFLSDEITFAVNSFWKHPILATWQPTYYCAVDAAFFKVDSEGEMALRNMMEAAKQSTFLIPYYGVEAVRCGALPESRTYFLSFAGYAHEGNVEWPVLHRPITCTWNVVQTAMLAALAMGCNPIYLLGCDHDWVANKDQEWAHFHPGNALVSADTLPFNSMCHLFKEAYYVFRAYEEIQRLCKFRGVSVLNATGGGMLDVFDRVNYDSLFPQRLSPSTKQVAALANG